MVDIDKIFDVGNQRPYGYWPEEDEVEQLFREQEEVRRAERRSNSALQRAFKIHLKIHLEALSRLLDR